MLFFCGFFFFFFFFSFVICHFCCFLLTLLLMSRSREICKCIKIRLDHVMSLEEIVRYYMRHHNKKKKKKKKKKEKEKTMQGQKSYVFASIEARTTHTHSTYVLTLNMYLRPLDLVLLTMIKMFVYIWYNDSWIKCLL